MDVIDKALIKADWFINNGIYENIMCSISGGSDSDVILDICHKVDKNKKVIYVWFDTGLEYQATKDHLNYLEKKYDIEIQVKKPIKSIPQSCKEHGQPFMSKYVSEMIYRLQKHNFKWENKSFKKLYKEYPNCKTALMWWCNKNDSNSFNIRRNKFLKNFMIENPPEFPISKKCCEYTKTGVAKKTMKENKIDLHIVGIRRAEGGARQTAYKTCFDGNKDYRPIFWFLDRDKEKYEVCFDIVHSKCYTEYGLKRTGCAGCPYGKYFEFELKVLEEHEPNLSKGVRNIFKESYKYTRKYKKFRAEKEGKVKLF